MEKSQQQQETSQHGGDDGDLTHPTTPPLLQLPPEILLHILSFLSLPQRCQLECVCRRLRNLGQDPSTWRSLHVDFRTCKSDLQLRGAQRLQDLLQRKKPRIQHFAYSAQSNGGGAFSENLMNLLLSCAGVTLETINITRCELPAAMLLFERLGQCGRMRGVMVDSTSVGHVRSGEDALLASLHAAKVPELLSVLRLSGDGYSGRMTLGGDWRQLRELEVTAAVTGLTFEGRWDRLEVLGVNQLLFLIELTHNYSFEPDLLEVWNHYN